MKYFLFIFCLVFFSCLPNGEEADSEEQIAPGSSSSVSIGPVEPDPSILECPPEDIAEYPVLEPELWTNPNEQPPAGFGWKFALSVEDLAFDNKGGVRCVTSSVGLISLNGPAEADCRTEDLVVSDSINDPQLIGVTRFKRLICPWFTATLLNDRGTINDRRTVHVLAKRNSTGEERKMRVGASNGDGYNGFTITQAAPKKPDFYFDEEKFQSEWNVWKSQDIKNYSFTLKGKLPYDLYPKAKNYIGAIPMSDYEVKITVKNGVMDSFEYIGKAPQENGAIFEPEYTSISDMYQKMYNQIKNHELELSERPSNGCFISMRYEIKYDQKSHYITHYSPIFEMDSGCAWDTTLHEVFVSDFLKN